MHTTARITEEYADLIEQIIKTNKYYIGNEDFFNLIFNEVYKKSYLLIKTISEPASIKSYLTKVVNITIIDILKSENRLYALSDSYVSLKQRNQEIKTQFTNVLALKNQNAYEIYEIPDPFANKVEVPVNKAEIKKMLEFVQILHSENKEKNYLGLFYERYLRNKSIDVIAAEWQVSADELNERLIDLANIIRENTIV